MKTCDFCGNPVKKEALICPYCAQPLQVLKIKSKPILKSIYILNLESGLPFVKEALELFNTELKTAQQQNIGILKIIHGYGSTGKGGNIKIALQQLLKTKLKNHQITKIISGENYSKSTKSALGNTKLIEAYPQLAESINADKYNRGITLIEL